MLILSIQGLFAVESAVYYDSAPQNPFGVAVLQLSGENLNDNSAWIPSFVRGILEQNLQKYSNLKLVDRNNAEIAKNEQKLGESGYFSKDSIVEIGNMTSARKIIGGNVIYKTGSRYTVQIFITDTGTGELETRLSKDCTYAEIQNGDVVNRLSLEILENFGVKLNKKGRETLLGQTAEADEALARSRAAESGGNIIAELNYLFKAQNAANNAIDSSIDSSGRLSVLKAEISNGGIGSVIRDNFEQQAYWKELLANFDDFYSKHLPFELIITPPTRVSQNYTNKTYDLHAAAGLRTDKKAIAALEEVIANIDEALIKTGKKADWGFAYWPKSSAIFSGATRRINTEIAVVNEAGQTISSIKVTLEADLYLSGYRVYPQSTGKQNLDFTGIKYNDNVVTPNLAVKVLRINNADANAVWESGYLNISVSDKLPPAGISIVPPLVKLAQLEKNTEKNEHVYRVGFNISGGPYIGSGSGILKSGLEVGVKHLDTEAGLLLHLGLPSGEHLFAPEDSGSSEQNAFGFYLGAGYSVYGTKWILSGGGGLSFQFFNIDSAAAKIENFLLVPYIQIKYDYKLYKDLFLNLIYRMDIFDSDLFDKHIHAKRAPFLGFKILDNFGIGVSYFFPVGKYITKSTGEK